MLLHQCAAHLGEKFSVFKCLNLVQNEIVDLVGEEDKKVRTGSDV